MSIDVRVGVIPRPAATGRIRYQVRLSPRHCGVEITSRAAKSGSSISAYLRAVGLNHPIRSVLDLKAVADLVRVNGDLGRVAGLLKLWLAEKRKPPC